MKKVLGMLLMSVTMLVTVTISDSVIHSQTGISNQTNQISPYDYDPGY
nr:hypothetical protein [Brevibacillus laterosporus]